MTTWKTKSGLSVNYSELSSELLKDAQVFTQNRIINKSILFNNLKTMMNWLKFIIYVHTEHNGDFDGAVMTIQSQARAKFQLLEVSSLKLGFNFDLVVSLLGNDKINKKLMNEQFTNGVPFNISDGEQFKDRYGIEREISFDFTNGITESEYASVATLQSEYYRTLTKQQASNLLRFVEYWFNRTKAEKSSWETRLNDLVQECLRRKESPIIVSEFKKFANLSASETKEVIEIK
jgi:hypothetical protein